MLKKKSESQNSSLFSQKTVLEIIRCWHQRVHFPFIRWRDMKRLAGKSSFHIISPLKSEPKIFLNSSPLTFLQSQLTQITINVSSILNPQQRFTLSFLTPRTPPSRITFLSPHSNQLPSTIHKNLRNLSHRPDNIQASTLKHLHHNSFVYLFSL